MQVFFDQIRQALQADLYYLALSASLMLPDICGAMETKNGGSDKTKYIEWFDFNVATGFSGAFSGNECYSFRCSLLHQGRAHKISPRYERAMFIEPGPHLRGNRVNIVTQGSDISFDLVFFCMTMVEGAEQWLKQAESTPRYKHHYAKFAQRHPDGLGPIGGVPVIG